MLKGTPIKYLLLSLLFFTQLFAYDTNKPMTVYGYVSEQVVHSSLTNKKENYYILDAYHIDGKKVHNNPLQLVFDNNKTKITIPVDQLSERYRLKGMVMDTAYKDKRYITHQIFKPSSIEEIKSKIKASSYLNNYSQVKLMIGSPMIDKEEAKLKKTDVNYITNIKVKADNKLLYNVNPSSCLAENPLMKFSYKDTKPLSLTLEYTDNNDIIKTNVGSVRERNREQKIPQQLKLLANAKSYPTQIESIRKNFGDITLIEDGIQLSAPKLAEYGGSIPISIRSNIKFKSLALFIRSGNWESNYNHYNKLSKGFKSHNRCGEGDDFSLVSQWFSTPYSLVDFSLRVTMPVGEGEVLVVLEAENGKYYTISKEVDVNISGG